jgi:hypothetical protein
MRTTNIKFGGKRYELKATWSAGEAIAAATGLDPLQIAQESQLAAEMQSRGIPYAARYAFSQDKILAIVMAGIEAGRDAEKIDEDGIKDGLMEIGLEPATEVAIEYLSLFIRPAPSKTPKGAEGAAREK